MATTDLHMHILPYDYVADAPTETTGLARTAALILEARKEACNTLLFDNGDFLHGTPMGDALARAALEGQGFQRRQHPIIATMDRLGYDAITLGNHDFDHGAGFLGRVIEAVSFPVVSSNIRLLPEPERAGLVAAPPGFIQPFALLDREVTDTGGRRHPLRVGVLGFLPPGSITGLRGSGILAETGDIVHTARRFVPHLRALGADLVVVLAHSGIGADDHVEGMENAVVPLAGIDGIDAIISGHAHQVFPGPPQTWSRFADPERGLIHGTPVVAPGFWGSHLGLIDLDLERTADGRWRVVGSRVEARPVAAPTAGNVKAFARLRPEPHILAMMEDLHDQTLSRVRQPIGETRRHLHSYFATVAPSSALDLVHRSMLWYARQQIKGTPLAEMPLVASAAPFKSGGLAGPGFYTDIPPGPLTLRSVADLYLYPNDLCALRLTGAELADWLERAASVFASIQPGGGVQPLMQPGVPAYLFEAMAGVSYEIDLSAGPRFSAAGERLDPTASRVRNLRLGDVPLEPDQDVLLVTNSFRVSGGGNYPRVSPQRIALDLPVCIRDTIVAYLDRTGPYEAHLPRNWRFAPVPGAEVTFVSSPEAAGFIAETGLDIAPGEIDEDGFQNYRLKL